MTTAGTAAYYAEAFYPMPGRCFRLISGGEGGGLVLQPEIVTLLVKEAPGDG
jgi:hypothetical protein